MCLDGIFRECIGGSDNTVYSNMVMQWYIVCGITRGGIRRSKVLSGWGCECVVVMDVCVGRQMLR